MRGRGERRDYRQTPRLEALRATLTAAGISSPATVAVVTAALFLASAVAQIVLRGWPDRVLMVLGLVLLVVSLVVLVALRDRWLVRA